MAENYTFTLQGLDLDRYVKKIQSLCGRQTCQLTQASTFYQFPSTEWIDDILLWSPVNFPSLCANFIEMHTGEAQGIQKS